MNDPFGCEWFHNEEGHHVCGLCGYVYTGTPVGPLRRPCPMKTEQGPPPIIEPWGLGDHTAMLLEAFGASEKRVAWFLTQLNLKCWCPERRRRLNQLGRRLLEWAKGRA